MARITIEDCMEKVPNRFELVRMASIRAKQLKKGARALIENQENKEVVTSLREIAEGVVQRGDAEVPAFDATLEEGALAETAPIEAEAVEDAATPADEEPLPES